MLTVLPEPTLAFANATTGTSDTSSPSRTSMTPGVREFVAIVADVVRS